MHRPDNAPLFESLEDRVLMSSTPIDSQDIAISAPANQGKNTQASIEITEILVIDTSLASYEQIITDIDQTNLDIHFIDSQKDGILQINKILYQYKNLDALHIVSHGSEGEINLGNSSLNSDSLDSYKSLIQNWSQSFTDSTDILIYGCDVAGNTDGQKFIEKLSQLTEADVAASSDITGFGGDTDFEFSTGPIESQGLFQQNSFDKAKVSLNNNLESVSFQNFSDTLKSATVIEINGQNYWHVKDSNDISQLYNNDYTEVIFDQFNGDILELRAVQHNNQNYWLLRDSSNDIHVYSDANTKHQFNLNSGTVKAVFSENLNGADYWRVKDSTGSYHAFSDFSTSLSFSGLNTAITALNSIGNSYWNIQGQDGRSYIYTSSGQEIFSSNQLYQSLVEVSFNSQNYIIINDASGYKHLIDQAGNESSITSSNPARELTIQSFNGQDYWILKRNDSQSHIFDQAGNELSASSAQS